MKKIFVFIIIELITIDCFCLTPWSVVENSDEYKSLSQSQKNERLLKWTVESDSILKTLPDYTPTHSEELKKFARSI